MSIEIHVPPLGESITEATVTKWFKAVGDAVARDEPLVELETDKVTLEVNAETAGTLNEIVANEGDNVEVGALLGRIADGVAAKAPQAAPEPVAVGEAEAAPAESPLSPAVRKLVEEHRLDPRAIHATGKGGRLVKSDVLAAIAGGAAAATQTPAPSFQPPEPALAPAAPAADTEREQRVRMTRLRKRIAERLKLAQNTAAMLTTFNEVDMTEVMAARRAYREQFERKHGVRLGFMSFFVKAAIVALKEIPEVNAEIDGDEIVYKNYYHIGVAISAPRGLVVPVLRDADKLSFAAIEQTIAGLGAKARDGKLAIEDLLGGTFTISNGGIFGSLLSTPILNPPQSAVLGMHKIQERPMAVDGQVVIRPMMYLALSYDHRLVDGREAVTFLIRIKECIEDPKRILLDL